MRCTYAGSHDENWVLELLRAEWGKPLNGTDWPPIQIITEEVVIRIYSQKMFPLARTQDSRWFRLDSAEVSKPNCYVNNGHLHVGVTSRVLFTTISNTSLIVVLSSLKSSAPEMAASA